MSCGRPPVAGTRYKPCDPSGGCAENNVIVAAPVGAADEVHFDIGDRDRSAPSTETLSNLPGSKNPDLFAIW